MVETLSEQQGDVTMFSLTCAVQNQVHKLKSVKKIETFINMWKLIHNIESLFQLFPLSQLLSTVSCRQNVASSRTLVRPKKTVSVELDISQPESLSPVVLYNFHILQSYYLITIFFIRFQG